MDIIGIVCLLGYELFKALRYAAQNRVLRQKVYLDEATGLPNKNKCEEILASEEPLTDRESTAVMVFDLNNLRIINDRQGHERGDQYIRSFAEQLRAALPEKYFVGRDGGDEFIAVLKQVDHKQVQKSLEENEVWFRSRCEGCSDIKLQPMRLGKDGSVSALAIYVENTVPNLILEESVLGRMFIDMAGKDPKEVYQAVEANSLGLSEAQPLQTREEGMNAMLAGNLLLLVEGYDKGLKIGSKGYPARSVDNTDTEKGVEGIQRRIYRVGEKPIQH